MNWFTRLFESFRRDRLPEPLRPVRPRVAPDPATADELERRRAELSYCPENGFHRDAQVVRQ